ncbi:MAG: AAA family ATPase [Bacteroidaceae bacterium]|nr:AAA family ATPase [Bacteroidaceae bacterium]
MLGQYIKTIEVDQLWHGGKHVKLEFQLGVNVLSGMNGMGKSTIISYIAKGLHTLNIGKSLEPYGVHIDIFPKGATSIKYNFVKSFDGPLMSVSQLEAITDPNVKTYLDWKLYKLLTNENFIDNIQWDKFCNLIDHLFSDTGKVIDRKNNQLHFFRDGDIIIPYMLSAGEKNLLIILLNVLLENQEPCVLLLDEPEICLHIDWQQQLLEHIRTLNPNAQIILSTHSPAIVMNGWLDTITEITETYV